MSLHKLDDARAWFDKSLAVAKRPAADDPNTSEWQRDLSVSYERLGDVAMSGDKLGDARTWFDKALAVRRVLCAATLAACVSSEPAQTRDEQALVASGDTEVAQVPAALSISQLGDDDPFAITPRACFIEGFCHDPRVNNRPSWCIHTGPCAPGEAIQLALTFCTNRCPGANCSNMVQLPACP